jgi:hypothetical protein
MDKEDLKEFRRFSIQAARETNNLLFSELLNNEK